MQVERKFQWNPYSRANIEVFNVQDAMKSLIGFIKEPLSPCFLFDIYLVNGAKEETKILTIKGTLCMIKKVAQRMNSANGVYSVSALILNVRLLYLIYLIKMILRKK